MKRPWVGPLLEFDLVRSIRRGRTFTLRVACLAVLLLALFFPYQSWYLTLGNSVELFAPAALTPRQLAWFGQSVFTLVIVVQLFAVLLLTPLYSAPAITEEKLFAFLGPAPLARPPEGRP